MVRALRMIAFAGVSALAFPVAAYADIEPLAVPPSVHLGVSLLGMLVAVILLVEALALRNVALGGAIAEKISYVVLAILCLAASAIVEWAANFAPAFTKSDVQLASEILVVVAMALLAAYFYSVRSAMQRYLRAMTEQQQLADERGDEWDASRSSDTNDAASGDSTGA